MKIVRFSLNGHTPRLGCFVGGDRVMDLAASGAAYLASAGSCAAEAIADALFPQSTRGFLERAAPPARTCWPPLLDASRAASSPPVTHPPASVRLHAPSTIPASSSASGSTTRIMRRRRNNPAPKQPPVFPKWANTIIDPGEPILRPRGREDARLGGGARGGDRAHRALRPRR